MLFSQKVLVALYAASAAGARQYPTTRDADKVLQSIGSLLQRDDKPSVQALSNIQSLASQLITPGVSDSLNSALATVIGEIEQSVESKLHTQFQSIQTAVDSAIDRLDASTIIAVERKATADSDDDSWFNCVRAEKAMLEGVEQANRDLQSARDSVTEPCQQQQDRTMFEKTSLEQPTFTCDHSESGNCDAQLQNIQMQVNGIVEGLKNDVNAQQQLYNEAKAACDAAHADVAQKQSAQETAVGEFDAKKIECAGYHEIRQLAFCNFGTGLQDKCHQASMYTDTVSNIEGSANEFSLSELTAEWETTYVVKCMLQQVMYGGSVDGGAVGDCESAVNFEQQVGQIDLKSAAYDGLTTPEKFTCSEQTITFRGETWETGATSSDYAVVSYSPAVSLEAASAPFAFCFGSAPGKP